MLNTSSLGYRISTPKHILFLMSREGAICTVSGSESLQDYNWNEPVIE